MPFSWKERNLWLNSLTDNPPELLIIGGGAVGCSIAAHAARLGLNVLLVERQDLASGASGNSTGLAHAGLRYLAQGHVLYVFHESRERRRLERIAPHWTRPFNFILPVYRTDPFKLPMVRVGTWIYDALSSIDATLSREPRPKKHQLLSADEVRARIPGIQSECLDGGVEYFVDAQLQDSRFTLGWAQMAARYGARILTYTEAGNFQNQREAPSPLILNDALSGKTQNVMPKLTINAAGAWIDGLRAEAGFEGERVSPSKGIHLVVDHIASAPLIFSTEIRYKVFFVIPWGDDTSLVGTTDTPVQGSIDSVRAEDREVQDLIRRLFQFFPYLRQGENIQKAVDAYRKVHVRDVYWGVRPLLHQNGNSMEASRAHQLVKDAPHFWSVPGVKLTAARAAGEEVARAAWKFLRGKRIPQKGMEALPGGEFSDYDDFVRQAQNRFKLDGRQEAILPYLVSRYGTRYLEVLRRADEEPHYRETIFPDEPWIPAEARYAADEEMVLTLNDFLWRRTKWAHQRDIPDANLHRIVNVLASQLEWSPDEVVRQLEAYQAERKRHRV